MQRISVMISFSPFLHPPLVLQSAYFFCRRKASALHAATIKNSIEMARILLHRGANVSATSEFVDSFVVPITRICTVVFQNCDVAVTPSSCLRA